MKVGDKTNGVPSNGDRKRQFSVTIAKSWGIFVDQVRSVFYVCLIKGKKLEGFNE